MKAEDSPAGGSVQIVGAGVMQIAGAGIAPFRELDDIGMHIAVRSDVRVLVELVNLAFEHEAWLIPGPRLRQADASHELIGPAIITLVATHRDTFVGTVRLQFDDELGRPRATPELGLLAVHPRAQGRGLGVRLVRAAERFAHLAGCDAIELRCGRELGLEAYYKALGYQWVAEEFGSMFGSYRPFTLVTLRRSLPAP